LPRRRFIGGEPMKPADEEIVRLLADQGSFLHLLDLFRAFMTAIRFRQR